MLVEFSAPGLQLGRGGPHLLRVHAPRVLRRGAVEHQVRVAPQRAGGQGHESRAVGGDHGVILPRLEHGDEAELQGLRHGKSLVVYGRGGDGQLVVGVAAPGPGGRHIRSVRLGVS